MRCWAARASRLEGDGTGAGNGWGCLLRQSRVEGVARGTGRNSEGRERVTAGPRYTGASEVGVAETMRRSRRDGWPALAR